MELGKTGMTAEKLARIMREVDQGYIEVREMKQKIEDHRHKTQGITATKTTSPEEGRASNLTKRLTSLID